MYLNNSRASTAENCLRRYFWENEFEGQGLDRQRPDENLAFGSIVHVGLACLYAGETLDKSLVLMAAEGGKIVDFENLPWNEKETWEEKFDMAARMLREYDKWRQKHDDFSVLQVEVEGEVVLGEVCWKCGWSYFKSAQPLEFFCPCGAEIHHYVFRIDLPVNQSGRLKIIDHKTTKRVETDPWHYSMQLFGYSYAYGKSLGTKVHGYAANILRKLKTIGTPQQLFKQCPSCKNGKNKKVGCTTCGGEGKIEKEFNPSAEPFVREWVSFDEEKAELFVRIRLRTIENILRERERFESEPDAAWPMNPKACFTYGKCPFVHLCYDGVPSKWFNPLPEMIEDRFKFREEDYVSVRAMAKEEMR